jgi:hypothetical protein
MKIEITLRPKSAALIRKLRVADSLLLAAMFLALIPFFVDDSLNWAAYSFLAVSAYFVVRAIVIRVRPPPTTARLDDSKD